MDDMSHRGQHQPPADGIPLHEADRAFPYLYDHPEWYVRGAEHYGASLEAINAARGKWDHFVTVYRAVPPGVTKINGGDWVTLSRTYAEEHAIQDDDPAHDWPVLSLQTTAASVLTDGNDLNEWGYFPASEHFCKDATIQRGLGSECCDEVWQGWAEGAME